MQYFSTTGRIGLTSSLVFHPAKISNQRSRGCVRKRELICTLINCQEKARDFIRATEGIKRYVHETLRKAGRYFFYRYCVSFCLFDTLR